MAQSINRGDIALVVAQKILGSEQVTQTGLKDDSELFVTVESFRRYTINAFVLFQLFGTTSGYKFKLNPPVDALASQFAYEVIDCVTSAFVRAQLNGTMAGALPVIGQHILRISGHLEMGPTDGVLQFQFSQNVLDAVNQISVRKNSFLEINCFG